jgi:hypothetical protein
MSAGTIQLIKWSLEGRLDEAMAVEQEIAAKSITGAVRIAGSYTVNAYKRQVTAAFHRNGEGIARGWQQLNKPDRGASMNAASIVFSKAKRIVAAFSQDRTISPVNGGGLLIPTQWAIQNGLDKDPSRGKGGAPRRYFTRERLEQQLGKLFEVKSPKGDLLLCYKDGLGKLRAVAYVRRTVRLRQMLDLAGPPAKFRGQLAQYMVNAMNRAERNQKRGSVVVDVG